MTLNQPFRTVQLSCPVTSEFLWPHGLHHFRIPCPLPTPEACSNLYQSSRWCHLTISSSVVPVFSSLQTFPASGSFFNESVRHINWPKYWSFSFSSISLSNEYSRLISFRVYWFDLLAVQATLKSLLQHHGSKASILWLSAFFMVQLLHPYLTIGKTIALTRLTFISKVMFLFYFFNIFIYF